MDIILIGALVVGLTQVAKISIGITSRYIPLTALIITGLLITGYAITSHLTLDWKLIADGFVIALTSVGLFSATKNTLQ